MKSNGLLQMPVFLSQVFPRVPQDCNLSLYHCLLFSWLIFFLAYGPYDCFVLVLWIMEASNFIATMMCQQKLALWLYRDVSAIGWFLIAIVEYRINFMIFSSNCYISKEQSSLWDTMGVILYLLVFFSSFIHRFQAKKKYSFYQFFFKNGYSFLRTWSNYKMDLWKI